MAKVSSICWCGQPTRSTASPKLIRAAISSPWRTAEQSAAITLALGLAPRVGFAFMIDNCSLTRLDHYQGRQSAGWRVKMINQRP